MAATDRVPVIIPLTISLTPAGIPSIESISVLALCLWNSRRPGLRWLYAVVGVMTLEVALELLGVRASTFESRTVIGMVAGAVVAPFIVEATEQTVLELWPAAAQDYAMPSSSKETT